LRTQRANADPADFGNLVNFVAPRERHRNLGFRFCQIEHLTKVGHLLSAKRIKVNNGQDGARLPYPVRARMRQSSGMDKEW